MNIVELNFVVQDYLTYVHVCGSDPERKCPPLADFKIGIVEVPKPIIMFGTVVLLICNNKGNISGCADLLPEGSLLLHTEKKTSPLIIPSGC
jgi:hypothetical protein